jgi:AcrR family transcriptional regulator
MKDTNELSLRERQKSETRQQIQNAARELITKHGFEKTTMRALAKEAGVGLGTISLHFKDKKSLLLASFHEGIGCVMMDAIGSVPQDEHIREQLLYILQKIYAYYATQTRYLRVVVKEALFTRGAWREAFDQQLGEAIVLMGALIESAKERGEVKPDINSEQVASLCWSIYLNGLIDGFKQERFDPDAQVAKVAPLWDIVLSGVLV